MTSRDVITSKRATFASGRGAIRRPHGFYWQGTVSFPPIHFRFEESSPQCEYAIYKTRKINKKRTHVMSFRKKHLKVGKLRKNLVRLVHLLPSSVLIRFTSGMDQTDHRLDTQYTIVLNYERYHSCGLKNRRKHTLTFLSITLSFFIRFHPFRVLPE